MILVRLKVFIIVVFSDDFATVDFREELCYHSRPKKYKFERRFHDLRVQKLTGFPVCFAPLFAPLRFEKISDLMQK